MSYIKAVSHNGIAYPKAYHKIITMVVSREVEKVAIITRSWTDSTKQFELPGIEFQVPLAVDTGDIFAWGYAQILALPEYADAESV